MKSTLILLLLSLIAFSAGAQDYRPLEPGNFWSYISDDGWQEMQVVGEQIPLFGELVYPIGHPGFDPFVNLVNYWSTGPDGDLLLHGWSRGTFGYLYQPPVLMVDSPLSVGASWSTTVDFYTATDSTYVDTYDVAYMVHDQAEITVPAGTFDCYGVGELEVPALELLGGRYNIFGEEIGSKTGPVDSWYAEDVGIVEEYIDQTYRLETYFDHQVTAESSSWGGVKALYR